MLINRKQMPSFSNTVRVCVCWSMVSFRRSILNFRATTPPLAYGTPLPERQLPPPPPLTPANRGLAPIKLSVVDILVKWTKVIGSQKINKRGSCFLYQFVLTFFVCASFTVQSIFSIDDIRLTRDPGYRPVGRSNFGRFLPDEYL